MTTVTRNLNALYKGVSDQSSSQSLPEQFEEQINGYSSVQSGLSRRSPLKNLTSENVQYEEVSPISRPVYRTKHSNGDDILIYYVGEDILRVRNAQLGTHTDISLSGKTYLRDARNLSFSRFGKKIFILNRDKVVQENSTELPVERRALARLKLAEAGSGYIISVDFGDLAVKTAFTPTFPAGDPNATSSYNTVNAILNRLKDGLVADGANASLIEVVGDTMLFSPIAGNTINNPRITQFEGYDYNTGGFYVVEASRSNFVVIDSALYGGGLGDVTDLPRETANGFTVRIVPDNDPINSDNYYYLTYDASARVWRESTGGREASYGNGLDLNTMPHVLQETAASFELLNQEDVYEPERLVGDDVVNPFPSFTERKINGMFFYSDRLVLFSENNLVTSNIVREGERYDFFRASAKILSNSDRIDVSIGNDRSLSNIRYALGQDKSLIVYSDQGQHILSSLDPNEARLQDIGSYEIDGDVSPVLTGDSSVFASYSNSVSNLHRFEIKDNLGNYHAVPITAHYSKSIKGKIKDILYVSNEDMLIILTEDDPRTLHVRRRFILDGQEIQNSWSTWKFSNDIREIFLENSKLYIYQEDLEVSPVGFTNLRLVLSSLDLSDPTIGLENNEGFIKPLLDNMVYIDRVDDYTQDPSSFDVLSGEALFDAFVPNDIQDNIAKLYFMKKDVDNLVAITVNGERISGYDNIGNRLKEEPLYIGLQYETKFVFSKQQAKYLDQDGSMKTERFSKFQLKAMTISFSCTGKFEVLVEHLGRKVISSKKYSGYTIGTSQTSEEPFKLTEGTFMVPIHTGSGQAKITLLVTDVFPVTIQSVEFLGKLRRIAQRY